MAITREEVLHVARLARLALSSAEADRVEEQLGNILAYIKQIARFQHSGAAARRGRDKETSSRGLTRALLSRIERLNPKINSYITVLPEHAMRDAAARDEELSRGGGRGPRHGGRA